MSDQNDEVPVDAENGTGIVAQEVASPKFEEDCFIADFDFDIEFERAGGVGKFVRCRGSSELDSSSSDSDGRRSRNGSPNSIVRRRSCGTAVPLSSPSQTSRSGSSRSRSGSATSRSGSRSPSTSTAARRSSSRSRSGSATSRSGSCSPSTSTAARRSSRKSAAGPKRGRSSSSSSSDSIPKTALAHKQLQASITTGNNLKRPRIDSAEVAAARSQKTAVTTTPRLPIGVKALEHYYAAKKKHRMQALESQKSTRRRRNVRDLDPFLDDHSDQIEMLLWIMKEAAMEDRRLNKADQPAINKISLLKPVMTELIYQPLEKEYLEHDVLSVLALWLSPLPTGCLPSLQIRQEILRLLDNYRNVDKSYLKRSGIGKAVNYLRNHPDEIKENRDHAASLINSWSRKVFGLDTELKDLTREEREELDLARARKFPRIPPTSQRSQQLREATRRPEPGDPIISKRAREPPLRVRQYVFRPESKVESSPRVRPQLSSLELRLKKLAGRKRGRR